MKMSPKPFNEVLVKAIQPLRVSTCPFISMAQLHLTRRRVTSSRCSNLNQKVASITLLSITQMMKVTELHE